MQMSRVVIAVLVPSMLVGMVVGCENTADVTVPPERPAVEQIDPNLRSTERDEDEPSSDSDDVDKVAVADADIHVEKAQVKPFPDAPNSFAGLVERVQPAVVNVYTEQIVPRQEMRISPMYGRYMVTRPERMQALGSGFIIDEHGYILTNTHVIKGADSVKIVTLDGEKHNADIVGTDPLTDIALLKIAPFDGMRVLPLGDAESVRIGDWLMAVGNPFGLQSTVTTGILSARGRHNVPIQGDIRYIDFLQTDASINPGNSGGPLIAMDGTVVGINTAVNAAGQGIGFAIPINMAVSVLDDLRQGRTVERSWLGVSVGPVPEQGDAARRRGALVTSIVRGGPAMHAGVRPGDIIIKFGDRALDSPDALPWLSSMAGVGSQVALQVERDGELLDIPVTMGRLPY